MAFFSLLLIAGCAQERLGTPVTWAQMKVETLELELVDSDRYELLMFGPTGMVSLTVGAKSGPLIGPLLYWRIEGDHLVVSEQPNADTYVDLYEPSLLDGFLVVRRGLFERARYMVRVSGNQLGAILQK